MIVIKNREQLVDNYIRLNESINIDLFHYDADKYEVGDIITKDSSNYITLDVVEAYKKVTGLDVSKVVYCRDFIFEDHYMDGDYNYCYQVSSVGKIFKGYMSFNADACMEAVTKGCNTMTRDEIIEEFSLAYKNNNTASQDNLLSKFPDICRPLADYQSNKERYEYICEKVYVDKICLSR